MVRLALCGVAGYIQQYVLRVTNGCNTAGSIEFFRISSGWFKHVEPHRTSSKSMLLERARCIEFFHISSGWFKRIEPHRTSSKSMLLERARCIEFFT